jgi:hypothetical protein
LRWPRGKFAMLLEIDPYGFPQTLGLILQGVLFYGGALAVAFGFGTWFGWRRRGRRGF